MAPTDSTVSLPTEWEKVTRGIRAGNADSLETFYAEYFDLMFTEAHKVTGQGESECLDIVQDSIFKLIQCIKPIGDQKKLSAFVRTVVRSVAYDRLRNRLARKKRELQYGELHTNQNPKTNEWPDPNEWVDNEARILWIEQQVERLDPEMKSIFRFRYRLGWSLKKIANKLGIKTGAVDGRIRRALGKIRSNAKEQFDDV